MSFFSIWLPPAASASAGGSWPTALMLVLVVVAAMVLLGAAGVPPVVRIQARGIDVRRDATLRREVRVLAAAAAAVARTAAGVQRRAVGGGIVPWLVGSPILAGSMAPCHFPVVVLLLLVVGALPDSEGVWQVVAHPGPGGPALDPDPLDDALAQPCGRVLLPGGDYLPAKVQRLQDALQVLAIVLLLKEPPQDGVLSRKQFEQKCRYRVMYYIVLVVPCPVRSQSILTLLCTGWMD